MKIAVNSLLSLLDVGTGFCYWLLGRDLLEEEVKQIQELFIKVRKPDDEATLIDVLDNLSPGKDLLLVCDSKNHNLVQWSVLNNYTQALIVLLEYGCNPTRTGLPNYDLPLALACCLGQMEMIQLLLDHGANPSQTTMLSSETLEYLSRESEKERYSKLIDLLKYRTNISSLSIVLTHDDLATFRLLMGETLQPSSLSGSSSSSSSSVNMVQMVDDHHAKIAEADFDIFREKLKLNEYTEDMPPHDGEECCMEKQQQHIMTQDDLSDCAEQGAFFSFCDTLDAESAVVNHNDATLALSEKGNQADRIHEEETCAPAATTDGGYCTVDGSSERVKSHPAIPPVDSQPLREIHLNKTSTEIEQGSSHAQRSEIISRTKSQQQFGKLFNHCANMHRHSLPANVYEPVNEQPSKRFRSTSSFLLSNMSNSTKHTAHLLRLLHQMIEHEAATILEYFLRRHRDEFNDHFHSAARSSDIQLKTYELLSNIKSDRIYNVLSSSNCAYFNTVTTSLCDRENNTLVHSLLGQNPLKYQPTEMIKMLERYMTCGLNEFINRPNLSNHCMIQILLCNEHFLKMIFFPPSAQSSSKYFNANPDALIALVPLYDSELAEKWRQSYLILVEILIKYGARLDMPAGSYRNSIDGLLSSLIDLSKRLAPLTTTFDIKYLKRLISVLLDSFHSANVSKNRSIYFKYNIERFIQLICSIHIHPEDLSDILAIVHHLIHYECQPIKLSTSTLLHLFKAWMTNPNFLCSSLIGKDLFMEQFLAIIVRRLSLSTVPSPNPINDNPLILTTTNNIARKSSFPLNDSEICLQNLFVMLLNLISYSQTCVQIQSIYKLIITFLNHTSQDLINHDPSQLPILFLCSQVKLIHPTLFYPFINLFTMVHTTSMVTRTKDILSQISGKRLSSDLYKYFLSIEKSKTSVHSLRHVSTKHLYHHLQKPYIDSVKSLPIGDALKERLLHFHDI